MDAMTLKLVGESPILMHSDRFANPLDPRTKAHKALTSKRKKTDEDHESIARSEWMGSLYHDPKLGPYVPTVNVRATLVAGGKLNKLGSAIQRSVLILEDRARLDYKGPREPEKLWETPEFVDARSVVVSNARLMRYRPVFRDWSLQVEVHYAATIINRDELLQCATNAGRFVGLGDFRPECGGMFGRFRVEVAS